MTPDLRQRPSLIGRRLGRYMVVSRLGSGGFGDVYLAQDATLGRNVALKVLSERFTCDTEQFERFQHEPRLAAKLNHPNIITVYDIGELEGIHFIATEYIDGQSLQHRMSYGAIELPEALRIAIQVAGALCSAHEAGILHRDIKPGNIMLGPGGHVKVLDFGVARLMEGMPSASGLTIERDVRTPAGWLVGTPHYIPPDQFLGLPLDGRTDIYSFGVVLYEMVAGRTPFEGWEVGELMFAIVSTEAPPLRIHAPEVPAELERIAAKALARNPHQRYQRAADMLDDLKALAATLESKLLDPVRINNHAPLRASWSNLEPPGGAVPLGSKFYIERPADSEFHAAIQRGDSIVLVKGARQVGKTSLLARGLDSARRTAGVRAVITDFQKLAAEDFESVQRLLLALAHSLADRLDLPSWPDETWNHRLSAGINFDRYLCRIVFPSVPAEIVWGLDEVDRVFQCPFASEVFGLFRSWHNERALEPQGPWRRFTLAMAYATEAHLFISDLNQSPFNVGTRLVLGDFTLEQVTELNRRYGEPLRTQDELAVFVGLVGGHPDLLRRGLHEMTLHGLTLSELEGRAAEDLGPFGDHLRRLLMSLSQDPALCDAMRQILKGEDCPTIDSFYRLRSAGLISGDSVRQVRPRCRIYASYLGARL